MARRTLQGTAVAGSLTAATADDRGTAESLWLELQCQHEPERQAATTPSGMPIKTPTRRDSDNLLVLPMRE